MIRASNIQSSAHDLSKPTSTLPKPKSSLKQSEDQAEGRRAVAEHQDLASHSRLGMTPYGSGLAQVRRAMHRKPPR